MLLFFHINMVKLWVVWLQTILICRVKRTGGSTWLGLHVPGLGATVPSRLPPGQHANWLVPRVFAAHFFGRSSPPPSQILLQNIFALPTWFHSGGYVPLGGSVFRAPSCHVGDWRLASSWGSQEPSLRKDWCWNTVEGASVAGCRSGDWCGNWQFSVNAGWHDKRSCYHRATDGRADGFRDPGDSKDA